jgi:hypothetical protein
MTAAAWSVEFRDEIVARVRFGEASSALLQFRAVSTRHY